MIPSLSLSTGPAISGAPTTGGAGATGDFFVQRTKNDQLKGILLVAVPALLIGGFIWWRKR